ncbi:MAG TPA: hypothetical protein VK862_16510 [Afifellaceae bacterium]|nr:hypothetical protein [Afifellaceae bacterium]
MNQAAPQTDDPIEFLSLRLFPAKLEIRAKAELLTDRKRAEAVAYIKAIDEFEAQLSELSGSSLKALIEDEQESDKQLAREKAEQEENSRFFYHPSARADYRAWIGRPTWNVDEATALLLGKNPDVVNWNAVNPLVYKSKFAKCYGDLRQQIKKAEASGDLHESRTPAAYLLFAKSFGFALPAELDALTTPPKEPTAKPANSASPTGDETSAAEGAEERDRALSMFHDLLAQNREKLDTPEPEPAPDESEDFVEAQTQAAPDALLSMVQEREMLLRMLGAMAIGGYGFDPAADNEAVTEKIVADFRNHGLSANPAAAHKLIGDAARLVIARRQNG